MSQYEAHHGKFRFIIENDPIASWCLYIYEGKDCTHDYLQDTFEMAIGQAEDDFGVPKEAWRPSIQN